MLHQQNVLAASKLLLPSLDLLAARERVCLHDTQNDRGQFRVCHVEVNIALEAARLQRRIKSVLVRLGGDCQLGHFRRRLIADDCLSGPTDIQSNRVRSEHVVEAIVGAITSTAAVEALETNIETSGIVLPTLAVPQGIEAATAYKRVKALRAILAIDRLGRVRRAKIYRIELATRPACLKE